MVTNEHHQCSLFPFQIGKGIGVVGIGVLSDKTLGAIVPKGNKLPKVFGPITNIK